MGSPHTCTHNSRRLKKFTEVKIETKYNTQKCLQGCSQNCKIKYKKGEEGEEEEKGKGDG